MIELHPSRDHVICQQLSLLLLNREQSGSTVKKNLAICRLCENYYSMKLEADHLKFFEYFCSLMAQ